MVQPHRPFPFTLFRATWNIGVGAAVKEQLDDVCGAVLGGHLDGGAAKLVPAGAMRHVVQVVTRVQQ